MSRRNDLTLKEKQELLKKFDNLPRMSQRNAAVQLRVPQPTLNKLLKNRSQIEYASSMNKNFEQKRVRPGKDEEVEKALLLWFTNVREKHASVNGPLMKQKAEELARKMGKSDFVATDGWFQRWKVRERIEYKRMHGEQKDADTAGAESWINNEWPKIIAEYSPEDVYNADETALYLRALPEHTYMFKNEKSKGCKIAKERITVLCCASMAGAKIKLLVIGKSKKPRCFKNVKDLPVDYYANRNAWMTSMLFTEWLRKFDERLCRKSILLVDNCTAHAINVTLENLRVVFLPPNTTSLIQPCDQGIIKTLKTHYRTEMRRRILTAIDDSDSIHNANEIAKKTSLLDAIHLLAASWHRVTAQTIQNCFLKGGFGNRSMQIIDEDSESDELPQCSNDLEEWMMIDDDVPTSATLTDDDVCSLATAQAEGSVDDDETEEDETDQHVLTLPSHAEVRKALEVLRTTVQAKCSDADFAMHYNYENFINRMLAGNCKQTTLDTYFTH